MPEGGATGTVSTGAKPAAPARSSGDEKGRAGEQGAKAKPAETAKAAAAPAVEKVAKPVIVAGVRCPHGVLEDPHRGFVRCLSSDEKNAKWLPPTPQREAVGPATTAVGPATTSTPAIPAPPTAVPATTASAPPSTPAIPAPPTASAPATTASAAPSTTAPRASAPPEVEVKAPAFESGEVPRAEKALVKLANDIGKCVGDNGGLSRATGTMKVQFLVRARGRAEGVEVLSSQGVSAEAASCVRLLLKNRTIGHPTADPVGVTVVLNFKQGAK
jgi:hypothetical protein